MASLLSLTALGAGCGSSSAPSRPASKLLVVSSARSGRYQIWLLNAGDGQDVRLTHDPSTDDYPAFSRDGRQIAWLRVTSQKSDDAEVWVMNADGSHPHKVAGEASASSELAWAPDGRHVYYASGDQGIDGLETANVDGGRDVHLGPALTSVQAIDPSWSPDGKQLAFEQDNGSSWQPYISDAKGERTKPVRGAPQDAYALVWSPDGGKLAMVVENHGRNGIYVKTIGGSGRFVYRGSVVDGVTWTPDGTHVVFAATSSDGSQLETVSATGGKAHRYLGALGYNTMPDWQRRAAPVHLGPVPGELAYVEDGGIYEMHPDGGDQSKLTSPAHDEADHDPIWSADGRSIAFVRTMTHSGTATWSEVWTMRADGSHQRRLSHEPGYDFQPSWAGSRMVVYYDSDAAVHTNHVREVVPGRPARTVVDKGFFAEAAPNGRLVAYAAPGTRQRIAVYAANLDGTQRAAVAGGPLVVYEIAWSPESSRIAFTAGASEAKTGIYVTALQGSSFVRLTPQGSGTASPAWSPDGSTVAYVRPGANTHQLLICERPASGGAERVVARVPVLAIAPPHLQWLADGSLGFFAPEKDGDEFHVVTQSGKVGPDLLQYSGVGVDPAWQPAPVTPSGPAA